MITNVTIVHKSKQNLHENLLTDIFYLFLSLSNQIPNAAIITAATKAIKELLFLRQRHQFLERSGTTERRQKKQNTDHQ
ncbi:MAG: hypothetical protein WAW09_03300 [Smithella sp.]|jgi:hypothetical protein